MAKKLNFEVVDLNETLEEYEEKVLFAEDDEELNKLDPDDWVAAASGRLQAKDFEPDFSEAEEAEEEEPEIAETPDSDATCDNTIQGRHVCDLRIDYPNNHYRFGEISGEMPESLIQKLEEADFDFFNISTRARTVQGTFALDKDECECIASLFSTFKEDHSSVIVHCSLTELERKFKLSDRGKQKDIVMKYLASKYPGVAGLFVNNYSYDSIENFFIQEMRLTPGSSSMILKILNDEYGISLFDLEAQCFNKASEVDIVTGIPTIYTKSGDCYMLRMKIEEDKMLLFNTKSSAINFLTDEKIE